MGANDVAHGGPLKGIKVVELQGRGPGPFGAMILADLGADVVRIERPVVARANAAASSAASADSATERLLRNERSADLLARGRRPVAIDLKHPDGLAAALELVDRADVLVEGYRPGAVERLGLGPDVCLERNPRLIYARITGWGQDGPYAPTPGHDINYVALSGALDLLRRPGQAPAPPLNYLGDWGGGGMLLAVGVLAALVERAASGCGQVIDTAMVDGVGLLSTFFHGARADGVWSDDPDENVLSLGAPFYNVYETADGRHISVGAGEPQFYAELVERIGADTGLLERQGDVTSWPDGRDEMTEIFKSRTRDEWCQLLEGTDTCFAPVLTVEEAIAHPHNVARKTFVEVDGVTQPAAAPRFSRTPASTPGLAGRADRTSTVAVLSEWGFDHDRIDTLVGNGAISAPA